VRTLRFVLAQPAYPAAENFERIHCLLVPCPILADIIRSVA
jgi:hypothetical protein